MRGRAFPKTTLWLAFPCILLALGSPAEGQGLRVGETRPLRVESPHPVPPQGWRSEVAVAGASFIKLRVNRLGLGPGDTFRMLGADGAVLLLREGPLPEASWLPSAEGGRLTLEILPAEGSQPWGIEVLEAGVGFPRGEGTPETVCNLDDRRAPPCYPEARQAAGDAVLKVRSQEGGWWSDCTATVVSPSGHILTCNHCIGSQASADSAEFTFRYQATTCDGAQASQDPVWTGADLLLTDLTLDFSLLALRGGNPATQYGFRVPDCAEAGLGDVIWIPQHGSGGLKKFAVESDMDAGGVARVDFLNLYGFDYFTDIGYWADTTGGSSGAPVLRSDDTIVALHHFGSSIGQCDASHANQGVKMSRILPLIGPLLGYCVLTCTGTAPPGGRAGVPLPFASSLCASALCDPPPAYAWDFGDGGGSSEPDPIHAYERSGTYAWTLSVTSGASTCTRGGALTVVPALPGDCDDDGAVRVGEVQRAINMFLGIQAPDCGADCDGDGLVSVWEVQRVINGFLGLASSC